MLILARSKSFNPFFHSSGFIEDTLINDPFLKEYFQKKVEIYYDEYEPTEPCISYLEREITYVNENYDLVLGSKPQTIDSIVNLTITIDVELFYKILLENNLKEFRDKLILSDIPEEKLNFEIKIDKEVWNDKSFEIWFFKIALFNHRLVLKHMCGCMC